MIGERDADSSDHRARPPLSRAPVSPGSNARSHVRRGVQRKHNAKTDMAPCNIPTAYNNAVEAAKLDDVNFYTLRHTFASWAVMRGVTLK
jgi:integrase